MCYFRERDVFQEKNDLHFHTIYAIKTEQSVYMAFSEEAPGREVDSPWQTAEQDFRAGYF